MTKEQKSAQAFEVCRLLVQFDKAEDRAIQLETENEEVDVIENVDEIANEALSQAIVLAREVMNEV
jgi:hypothetical protein